MKVCDLCCLFERKREDCGDVADRALDGITLFCMGFCMGFVVCVRYALKGG